MNASIQIDGPIPTKEPKMGGTPQKEWGKYIQNTLLATGVGGGVLYIPTMQEKFSQQRESQIRLEVKMESMSEEMKRSRQEQEHLRQLIEELTKQLHDRKVVFQADTQNPTVVGSGVIVRK